MTHEEALKTLKEKYIGIGSNDLFVFLKAAEALEKQIPKKPKKYKGLEVQMCKCPNCGYHLGYDFEHVCFCQFCGQALDWSE